MRLTSASSVICYLTFLGFLTLLAEGGHLTYQKQNDKKKRLIRSNINVKGDAMVRTRILQNVMEDDGSEDIGENDSKSLPKKKNRTKKKPNSDTNKKSPKSLVLKCPKKNKPKETPNKGNEKKVAENEDVDSNKKGVPGDNVHNDTRVAISYHYLLESTKNMTKKAEKDLKRNMFDYLSEGICDSPNPKISKSDDKALNNEKEEHHSPILTIESTPTDKTSGSCTPSQSKNNTCAKYDGEIVVMLANNGDTDKNSLIIDDTEKSVLSKLKLYAEKKMFGEVNDNVIKMEFSTSDRGTSSEAITDGSNADVGGIVGMVAGLAVLSALLYGMFVMKRKRRR